MLGDGVCGRRKKVVKHLAQQDNFQLVGFVDHHPSELDCHTAQDCAKGISLNGRAELLACTSQTLICRANLKRLRHHLTMQSIAHAWSLCLSRAQECDVHARGRKPKSSLYANWTCACTNILLEQKSEVDMKGRGGTHTHTKVNPFRSQSCGTVPHAQTLGSHS